MRRSQCLFTTRKSLLWYTMDRFSTLPGSMVGLHAGGSEPGVGECLTWTSSTVHTYWGQHLLEPFMSSTGDQARGVGSGTGV